MRSRVGVCICLLPDFMELFSAFIKSFALSTSKLTVYMQSFAAGVFFFFSFPLLSSEGLFAPLILVSGVFSF